jgi:hypothetical protein
MCLLVTEEEEGKVGTVFWLQEDCLFQSLPYRAKYAEYVIYSSRALS